VCKAAVQEPAVVRKAAAQEPAVVCKAAAQEPAVVRKAAAQEPYSYITVDYSSVDHINLAVHSPVHKDSVAFAEVCMADEAFVIHRAVAYYLPCYSF